MSSFTELLATHGRMMELTVLGAVCVAGVLMLAWGKVRGRVMMVTSLLGLACMLCASAAPPEKPIPKALPVADDEPKTPLTRMMEEADKEMARVDKNRQPQAPKKAETPLGRYYRQVVGLVEKKWHIYLNLRRQEGLTKGFVQLVFYINKKGKVESLKVLNDKESNPLLTEITLQAIKDAEIPPIPVDVIPLLPENDPERMKFLYDALIY